MTDFGPQLIGQTEKVLNAVLAQELAPFALTEPQWVTLRLATQRPADERLDAFVARQSHYPDAAALVEGLSARGLLLDDALTEEGHALREMVQASIRENVAHVWDSVDPEDAQAAARALSQVRQGYLGLLRPVVR